MTRALHASVRTSDGLKERVIQLKDTSKLSFRKISKLPDFHGMPAGTICAVYHGAEVPHKWRKAFGLVDMIPAPACPKCGQVHVTARCTANAKAPGKWVRVFGHGGWELR